MDHKTENQLSYGWMKGFSTVQLEKFFHALKIIFHALKIFFHALEINFHPSEIFLQIMPAGWAGMAVGAAGSLI